MDPKNNYYTDNFPGMSSRHFFVLDFLSRFANFKNKKIIDFTVEKEDCLLKKKYFKCSDLNGVEHSKRNILIIKKRFKKEKLNHHYTNQILRTFMEKADGILAWTLCNCSEPLKVVNSISNNIRKKDI